MILRLLGAIQFLTILPVRGSTAPSGHSALFFPLTGAALGAAGGLLFYAAGLLLPPSIAAIVVLGFWALVTGGLHEDGLADVADAVRAGRPREKIFAILKDSRIGAHGALALMLIVLLRWQALSAVQSLASLAAVLAVSRTSMVALTWVARPAGTGAGFEFSRSLSTATAAGALLQAAVLSALLPGGIVMLLGAALVVGVAKVYFERRLGGVTGDCLGATCLLVETWGLAVLACRRCI